MSYGFGNARFFGIDFHTKFLCLYERAACNREVHCFNGAQTLAEKLRESIAAYTFPEVVSITASFGVAQFEKYDSIVKVFDKADKALYEAKAQGRNRVVAFDM